MKSIFAIFVCVVAVSVFLFWHEREFGDISVLQTVFPMPEFSEEDSLGQVAATLSPRPAVVLSVVSASPAPTPVGTPEQNVVLVSGVPFAAQAPFGEWSDPRQQDACEEASAMLAMHWVNGKPLTLEQAKVEVLAVSQYQSERYGFYQDTSATDTVARIFNGYYGYYNVRAEKNIGTDDILRELRKGNLVIVPANGRRLGNVYYTPPGPLTHMLPIIGYDEATDEFITNDVGTRQGKGYRYSPAVLANALQDYPTGPAHGVQIAGDTAMIVVEK